MKIDRIYVIAAQHGDEVFGLKILGRLQSRLDPRVVLRVGHPEAVAKRRRYIDHDLNRSFGSVSHRSLEHDLAAQIKQDIAAHRPDLILDLHTSRGTVGRVGIVANDAPQLGRIAARLGMQRVVVMPDHIANVSLIGQYPDRALSLEFGTGQRTDKLAKTTADAIAELVGTTINDAPAPLPQFTVERTIQLHEAPGETLQNYRYNPTLGGYPFLVGKNTYTTFRGFLAHKQQQIPDSTV